MRAPENCASTLLHYELEAHDRAEVAIAEATAQTPADMLHEVLRIEQVAEHCFESAIGDSQPDELDVRKCHTRAKKYVDVSSICRNSTQ